MLTTILNVLLIILGFGVLIFIHELGHFIAAKWAGIRTEAFAVGMGPVAIAWRKGIGLRFGSTAPEYEKRVHEFLSTDEVHRPRSTRVSESLTSPSKEAETGTRSAELPQAEFYRIGDKLGLGETEYSLRRLPLGGFVKMLGQEDANPNAVSDDPRSYNMRPIGKRMIVVSAGVIMNLILAVVLFVIAFMAGVRFPAAVVGDVSPILPAVRTMPENARALGITEAGLQAGDRIISIDGEPVRTFADVQIASAMSKPDDTLTMIVERPGVKERLTFKMRPEKDPSSGLLSIGILPGASTHLIGADLDDDGLVAQMLERTGLSRAGVQLGMTLVSVNGQDVAAFGQLAQAVRESEGQPLHTTWASIDEQGRRGKVIEAALEVKPDYEQYLSKDNEPETGLAGFAPVVRIARVLDNSRNRDKLRAGDVLMRIGDVTFPRISQVHDELAKHRRQDVEVVVLRDGVQAPVTVHVDRGGKVGIGLEAAEDLLLTAQPVIEYARYRMDDPSKTEPLTTPVGRSDLFTTGGTRVLEVAGQPVETWPALRSALLEATREAASAGTSANVHLLVQHPVNGSPREAVSLEMTADEIKRLHDLKWHVDVESYAFEPLYTIRKGSPTQAVAMGFDETRKMVLMVYLTIDRLIRGSLGVDQLRGPVGIVHVGTKVAREGLMYLLLFLGVISANLAVINFLPLPIVDGGLFLFLIYEKLKGKPPSLAFQNAATIVGLLIIGTAFVVTFYNDVLRLFS